MDGSFNFLFSAEDAEEFDDSAHNSDGSDIDEETSCLLYSQIYYDACPDASGNVAEPVLNATGSHIDTSSAQPEEIASENLLSIIKDNVAQIDSDMVTSTPRTKDNSIVKPQSMSTPIAMDEMPPLTESAITPITKSTITPTPKSKVKMKDKERVKEIDEVVSVSSDSSSIKSTKKRKKGQTTDKKKLAKFMKPIEISGEDSNIESKSKADMSKAKTSITVSSDSGMESKSKAVQSIKKKNAQIAVADDTDKESKGEKKKKKSAPVTSTSNDSDIESKTTKKSKKTKTKTSSNSDSGMESKAQAVSSKSKMKAPSVMKFPTTVTSDSDSESESETKPITSKSITKKLTKKVELSGKVNASVKKSKEKSGMKRKSQAEDSAIKTKKSKLFSEHVSVSEDIDSSDDDIIALDSDTYSKIVDISDDSDCFVDDSDSCSEYVTRIKRDNSLSTSQLLLNLKSKQDKPISMGGRASEDTIEDNAMDYSSQDVNKEHDNSVSGLHVNMDMEDSPLVKSVQAGKGLRAILNDLDDGDWSTNISWHTPKASSTTRYYTSAVASAGRRPMCKKCHVVHLCESECKKREPTCFICCEKGHLSSTCPRVLCRKCNSPEHRPSDCPNAMSTQFLSCNRCHMRGHKENMCPDIWRQYHITTNGSDVPEVTTKNLQNPQRFCANCASTKHFVFDCKASRPRRNDFVQYSMIARYDSAHTVKERSKHAPLPKQLKYIDDQKNGTPRKGSELVEEALKSYGKELPEKKQSQKARRYNNGYKAPEKWDEPTVNGFQRSPKKDQYKSVNLSNDKSTGASTSKPASTTNGFQRNSKKRESVYKSVNLSNTKPSTSQASTPSAKQSVNQPVNMVESKTGQPHETVKTFIKTSVQTTQKLNMLKNKLKREKKERKMEKKREKQERLSGNQLQFEVRGPYWTSPGNSRLENSGKKKNKKKGNKQMNGQIDDGSFSVFKLGNSNKKKKKKLPVYLQ